MSKIIKENFLNYKDTYIYQDKESFCYSLDSILLANFININFKKKVMDLATGNLPIPLILYKKYGIAVDCIELQKDIYELGCRTIDCNNLKNYINLYNCDINDVNDFFKINSYDIVCINPPYFVNMKLNDSKRKSYARHEVTIDFDTILKKVNYLLNNGGHFYMIHRTERFIEIISKLKEKNLMPKRVSFIYPNYNSTSKLFLIECIKNGKNTLIVDKPVIIYEEEGIYSKNILDMLGDSNDSKKL